MAVDYKPIDADNHYYESLDAFTRYLDREYKRRGVQVVKNGTHTEVIIGGRVNEFIPNPTFDPVIVPGCMDLQFRGQVPPGVDPRSLMKVEPISPAYRNRDARLDKLTEQGLQAALLFPTLACGVEEALAADIPATMASLSAFNRWLEEDWGFSYQDRLLAAPMISLADPDVAAAEVESVVARGARLVHMRPAPVPTGFGKGRSLGDTAHDPVWARLAEASIPVAFHLGDSGYNRIASAWGGPEHFVPFRDPDILGRVLVSDRAIHDTMASLIVHGVFTRHPALRVASVENGSDWLPLLTKRLHKQANQTPWAFSEDPLDTIKKNIWVTPYYEEDLRKLADLIGVDRILFGSDWPHGEGLAEPAGFADELDQFDDNERRQIMHDNCARFLGW
ncbi:MAG: amidohydrolase family protein [Acidimicrobiales bacterium]